VKGGRHSVSDWTEAVDQLIGRSTESGALVALALLSVLGPANGWPIAWREALRQLRSDQSPWVREQASFVLTATE